MMSRPCHGHERPNDPPTSPMPVASKSSRDVYRRNVDLRAEVPPVGRDRADPGPGRSVIGRRMCRLRGRQIVRRLECATIAASIAFGTAVFEHALRNRDVCFGECR